MQPDRGEFLGVGHRIGAAQRIVLFVGDILESTRRHEQLVLAAQLPVGFQPPDTHVGRIALEPHLGRTRFGLLLGGIGELHGRGIEFAQRIVELQFEVVERIHVARGREVDLEGVGLFRLLPLLAGRFGAFALAFELFALLLLRLALDIPPCEFQRFGHLLQPVDRIVFEIGDLALDRIGKRGRGHVEPQGHRIAPHGLGIPDDPLGGDAVEPQAGDFGMRGAEIEHGLVPCGTFRLLERLPFEGHVGEHPHEDLRIGRDVMAQRVVPDRKVGHQRGVDQTVQKTHLVDRRFVHLVVVGILEGVDAVGNRFEVLRQENAVGLGAGDDLRLVVEQRRIVLFGFGNRVGDVKVDEALAYAVGLVGVDRIARQHHRIDLGSGRKDVTHRVEGVALVVVADRAAEIERIGGILPQRIAQLNGDSPPAQGDGGFLLHLRRGEELLLLILDLDELVELDIDLAILEIGREVVGRHQRDDGGQRILRAARGRHDRGAAPQKRRTEEDCERRAPQQRDEAPSFVLIACSHRRIFRLSTPDPCEPDESPPVSPPVSPPGLSGSST